MSPGKKGRDAELKDGGEDEDGTRGADFSCGK